MKAKELAKLLMEHPNFEVDFAFSENDGTDWGITIRIFDVEVGDIGYSGKIFRLSGTEK